MAVVYQHRRLDTNQVFYIGIGKDLRRPYEKGNRNKYWNNIVNHAGYSVEIVMDNLLYDQAKKLEIYLIDLHGRTDLKKGSLCNLTDGGEGMLNTIVSNETRQKQSKSRTGRKHTEEARQKISSAHKGRLVSDETRKKLSDANAGKWSGSKNPTAKRVIDTYTGVIYGCGKEAASSLNLNYGTLKFRLNGRLPNKTTLKYL